MCLLLMVGCESGGKGTTSMADYSGGSVSFGKLVSNASRVGEAEPGELSKTIHNQLATIVGKYTYGGVPTTADFDLMFGPYPSGTGYGEIKLVESPGTDHVPEMEIQSGYIAVGGSCPIARAPGSRLKSTGTQFAAVVKPESSGSVIYVVYINQTGSEDVEVASTSTNPPSGQKITSKDKYVKITVNSSGVVTAIAPEASISSGDSFVMEFYAWVKKEIGDAGLRN